jgi:hypothetical protein
LRLTKYVATPTAPKPVRIASGVTMEEVLEHTFVALILLY